MTTNTIYLVDSDVERDVHYIIGVWGHCTILQLQESSKNVQTCLSASTSAIPLFVNINNTWSYPIYDCCLHLWWACLGGTGCA